MWYFKSLMLRAGLAALSVGICLGQMRAPEVRRPLAAPEDPDQITNWQAPLYYQPASADEQGAGWMQNDAERPYVPLAESDATPEAAPKYGVPAIFVAVTPCRLMDTRTGSGFTGSFGPPSLTAGSTRTIPAPTGKCGLPATAVAYSFNIGVIPTGVSLRQLTAYPYGQPRPNIATVNDYSNLYTSNGTVVAAGVNGSVNIFVTDATNVIIDVNGYYALPSALPLVLEAGTAAKPALTFGTDATTGLFSTGAGTLSIATGGATALTVDSKGDLDLKGSITKGGVLFLSNLGSDSPSSSTALGLYALGQNAGTQNTATGYQALQANTIGYDDTATGSGALENNETGTYNTAMGFSALASNTGGDSNTAMGNHALYANTAGYYNTAMGEGALYRVTTGTNNTGLGAYAGFAATTGRFNIFIANQGQAADTNLIRIGDSNQTATFISGIRGVTPSAGNAIPVVIDSNGQLGTVPAFPGGGGGGGTTGLPNGTASAPSITFADASNAGIYSSAPDTINFTTNGSTSAFTIGPTGNLDISGSITQGGVLFLHDLGGLDAGNNAGTSTALGLNALAQNAGWGNVATGYYALNANTTGNSNTATGDAALQANTTGNGNTAVGWQALIANTTGFNNTASGLRALAANTTGASNTAAGVWALIANTAGGYNTATGLAALSANTTGGWNTATGNSALQGNTTGAGNTAMGYDALLGETTGSFNTALGQSAGSNATTGSYNVFIANQGQAADTNLIRIGDSNQTATFISGIRGVTPGAGNAIPVVIDSNGQLGTVPAFPGGGGGTTGLPNGTASAPSISFTDASNAGIYSSAPDTINFTTDGATNALTIGPTGNLDISGSITKGGVLFLHDLGGLDAGNNAGTSTALGLNALAQNAGWGNVATGYYALNANTTGNGNTAIGYQSLQVNETGVGNTAVGVYALSANTIGGGNTALGSNALQNTTGGVNTATGADALFSNTAGSDNTAMGGMALSSAVGSYNTALGSYAGRNATTGSHNVFIANWGTAWPDAESNTIRIGDVQMATFIAGIRDVTTGNADAIAVVIDSAGQLGTVSSSRNVKRDIADMGDTTETLMSLRPVQFHYTKYGPDSPLQYGLIAEEVAEVAPELVARKATGEVETVFYDKVNAMLLNEVQKLRREKESLAETVRRMEERLAALEGGK